MIRKIVLLPIFLFFVFILAFVTTVPPAEAQSNGYRCVWDVDSPQPFCRLGGALIDCNEGYVPGTYCENQTTAADCNAGADVEFFPNECIPDNNAGEVCDTNGDLCCGGSFCTGGLVCGSEGVCVGNCGGLSQSCCSKSPPNDCDGDLRCEGGVCKATSFLCVSGQCTRIIGTSGTFSSESSCNSSCGLTPTSKKTKRIESSPLGAGDCGGEELESAIGCIPISSATAITKYILARVIGIAGGIAFLLIIRSGFVIMTSAGDPKKLQGGKELMTAAIGGLVIIIFSTFILRIFGVNLFGIF